MAVSSRQLVVEFVGDESSLKRASKEASKSVSQLGNAQVKAAKQTDEHIKANARLRTSFGNLYARGGEAIAAVFALESIKKGVESVLDAYKEQQVANTALQTQMKALNQTYSAHSKAIEDVIKKTSQMSGLTVPDLTKAYTELDRATGSVSQSTKLLTVTADLARAKNLDLARAGLLVGKVAAGNTSALTRYGVILKPVTAATDDLRAKTQDQVAALEKQAATTTGTAHKAIMLRITEVKAQAAQELVAAKATDKQQTAQNALAELQKRFAGQAKAYGDTTAGAADKLRAAWEEVRAELGAKLAPVVTRVTLALTKFVTGAQDGTGAGGQFAHTMRDLGDALTPVAHDLSVGATWLGKHRIAMSLAISPVTQLTDQLHGLAEILNTIVHAIESVVSAVKSLPGVFKSVGGTVKSIAGSLNPFGDGIGKAASSLKLPSVGGFNSLDGAKSSLAPFAGLASSFGLHTTSGLRPGAITVSGNTSYHSSGNAIDEAGSPTGMMAYFRYLKSHFGGRLAELIYTPGGVGIKDGKPYQYTGAVAAEHNDHVHVAYTGAGDGHGKPRTGDGIGQIESLWVQAGGRKNAAAMAAAIAMAESGGNPSITHRNDDGSIDRGLWQINSTHGSQSTIDPRGNARAAVQISSDGSNWSPWTTYTSGAYKKFLTAAQKTIRNPKLAATIKPALKNALAPGSGKPGSKPSNGRGGSDDAAAALSLTHAVAAGGRPGGVHKGNTPDQQTFLSSLAPSDAGGGDPNQPLIDALAAEAAAQQALTQALADVKASLDAQTSFATSVSNTSNYQLTKMLTDVISGQLGRGIVGRSMATGNTTGFAY